MKNNYINHVSLILDCSQSMEILKNNVIDVFDSQVRYLAKKSQELDQETRVSVYLFNDNVECVVYDKDVLRLPSIKNIYKTRGSTALIDAAFKSINDGKLIPELYGDHSHLYFFLTDGYENRSMNTPSNLNKLLNSLPENWTVAALVPDQAGKKEAIKYGFPEENVQIWETSAKGMKEVDSTITRATNNFMTARAKGVRGVKNLFTIDPSSLSSTKVKNTLSPLNPSEYHVLKISQKKEIKPFVESWLQEPYRVGSAYYMITKPEKIQASKQILIQEKISGKVFSGINARNLLNLPDYEVKVTPSNYGQYNIFVQSTSINRHLVPGTDLIVLK